MTSTMPADTFGCAWMQRLFADHLGLEVSGVDVDLFETALLDSLGFTALLAALESELGVSVPVAEVDLEDFRTIDRITALVARLQASAR